MEQQVSQTNQPLSMEPVSFSSIFGAIQESMLVAPWV
jgi:hypothetical protein